MTDSYDIIPFAEAAGWNWANENVLVHPADRDLAIQRDALTGKVMFSPKLIGLIAMENWQYPDA